MQIYALSKQQLGNSVTLAPFECCWFVCRSPFQKLAINHLFKYLQAYLFLHTQKLGKFQHKRKVPATSLHPGIRPPIARVNLGLRQVAV